MLHIDKNQVRDKLIEAAAEELKAAEHEYHDFFESSKIDRTTATDVDEQGQANTAAGMASSMGRDARSAQVKLSRIQDIDFGPKRRVEEGAIVSLDGKLYVISVATNSFTVDGQQFTGLSPAAPIYKTLDGKKAGDTVKFRGTARKIDAVW